jgi:hypothetical protein
LPKALVEFRAQNLRLLEQLCPDDPRYVQSWIHKFDEQNGIEPEARPKSRLKPNAASQSKARSRARSN